MHLSRVVILSIAIAACTACGPGSGGSSTETTAPVVTASTDTAPATPAARPAIWFEPAGLSACARPEKVMANWDVRPIEGVKMVELIAVAANGQERLFLAAGRAGNRETGAWMRAGSTIILRNKENGSELGRAVVESIPCAR